MVFGLDGSRAFVSGRTGTENYSYQLLKALAKIDKKNQYIVYLRSVNSLNQLWPDNFQFKIIKWPRLWTQAGLAIQTFQDKPDVLFVPAHTLPVIRKPSLKTVVTVHDLGSEYLPSMHQIKQRLYLGFMQRIQLKSADKIIAVSEATKKDLVEKLGIGEEKITVIYEGYDKERFKMQKSKSFSNCLRQSKINQTIKKYNLMYHNYFLFVGTVQPRKNLERLIIAFSRLPLRGPTAIRLVIVGQKGWMSEQIYALPKKLGIGERVKFLGYVPENDLPALYSGALALTFPSLFEGFGLPILEAQACGCPVLTSNVSSTPEVAGKEAIYVDPYSVDDIVEGMGRLQVTGYRQQVIKSGFENIKRFSWEKCAKETLEVLESV